MNTSCDRSDKHETSPNISQEFRDSLETLVLEILRDKPEDPLQFASDFFAKKLQNRPKSKVTGTIEENVTKEQKLPSKQPCKIKAATIIQACFRGYNVRNNWWKKRFVVTKLKHNDHLSARRVFFNSPRESVSGYLSDVEDNDVLKFNYDSD